MRSQIEQIYSELMLGRKIKVTVQSENEYHTIRTALHKHNRLVQQISDEGLSLQATLAGMEALFCLGRDRRRTRPLLFEIVDTENETVSETLEQTSKQRNGHNHLL